MAKLINHKTTSDIIAQVRNFLRQDYGLYSVLAVIRILLVFFTQTGYVHKDEFFESFEDAAGDALSVDSARGWRMDSSGTANRHVTFPLFMIGAPLVMLRISSNFWSWVFSLPSGLVTPYTILITVRLLACILSFVTDYYVGQLYTLISQKTASSTSQTARRMVLLAGSAATIIYGTRTLTSALEMSLYTALVYQVIWAIVPTRARAFAMNSNARTTMYIHHNDLSSVFFVASLAAFGCHNRPGFALFAAFPVLAWMLRSHKPDGSELRATQAALALLKRALSLAFASAPAFILLSTIDTNYYGPPPPATRGAPFESVALVNEPAADENDPRPPWTVFLNCFWAFNIIGLVSVWRAFCIGIRLLLRKPCFTGKRLQAVLAWCSSGPLFTMAVLAPFGMGMKEPHALLPLLPLFVLLNADLFSEKEEKAVFHYEYGKMNLERVHHNSKRSSQISKILMRAWMLCNFIFVIHYGFLRDAGTYKLVNKLHDEIALGGQRQIYVCTCRVPAIPVALLGLPKEPHDPEEVTSHFGGSGGQRRIRYGRRVYMNELGDCTIQELHRRVVALLDMCRLRYGIHERRCTVMAALPGTVSEEYETLVARRRKRDGVKLSKDAEFFPHISPQAPANWSDVFRSGVKKRFSLMVYTAHRTNG